MSEMGEASLNNKNPILRIWGKIPLNKILSDRFFLIFFSSGRKGEGGGGSGHSVLKNQNKTKNKTEA